jgi:hypothetical protein
MADNSKPGRRSRILAWTAALVIILPILYVLSAGPAVFVAVKSEGRYLSYGFIDTFYAPVEWLDTKTVLHAPLEWYLSLWCPP